MTAKSYSDRTFTTYSQEIKKFLMFIEEYYPRIKNITHITKETISDYVNYLVCYKDDKGNNLSVKTIKLKIISLRNFFGYLLKHDYVLSNPMILTELPREERELPRSVLSEDEVKEILSKIKTNTPIGLRNKGP